MTTLCVWTNSTVSGYVLWTQSYYYSWEVIKLQLAAILKHMTSNIFTQSVLLCCDTQQQILVLFNNYSMCVNKQHS